MGTNRVVIVGTSIGGIRTAQALRAGGFADEIILIGAEDVEPYDKPPLSKQYLAGEKDRAEISLLGNQGWAEHQLEPMLGRPAKGLNTARKEVILDDDDRVSYQHLVIATGARARTLLGPEGTPVAHSIRDLKDAVALRNRIAHGGPVVVVGGGFIGAEVASTARRLGAETTIVEAAAVPFSRVLGSHVGQMLAGLHLENSVNLIAGVGVESVVPVTEALNLVHLADGRTLEAAAVVAGIGIIPNTEWLESSGISIRDGVLSDEYCAVEGTPDVYTIGDVARWKHETSGQYRRVEHWTNAVDQANLVAHNILHSSDRRSYNPAPYFWSDQYETKIQMVGDVSADDHVEVHTFRILSGERRVALYSQNNRLSAAVSLGWPRAMALLRRLWQQQAPATEVLLELEELAQASMRARVVTI